jgi:anti-anti-sigma factor
VEELQVLQATVDHVEGEAVVALDGELDMATSHELDQVVGRLISEGHTRLVLDLSALAFVDSAGLSALLTAQRRARAAHGWLALRGATPRLRMLLEATHLDSELHLEDRDGRRVPAMAGREGAWI